MSRYRTLVACLCVALGVTWLSPGAGARDGRGGVLAQPVHGLPSWSADAVIVSSVNAVLLEYAGLSAAEQAWLERYAVVLAKLRRASLKRLIEGDPRQALRLSLSPGQRQGLPKPVLDLLEVRVHTRGTLTRAITEEAAGDQKVDSRQDVMTPVSSWSGHIGQSLLRAFLYGIRLRHQSKFDTPIHGIALGGLLAVSESPIYQYDPFETVQLGFQPGQIVATDGALPIPLPDIQALIDLEQDLIRQILDLGPIPLPGPDTWTTGLKRLLVIKVTLRGDLEEPPYTDADIAAAIGGANTFFRENSQGRTLFASTILTAPVPICCSLDELRAAGEDVAHGIIADSAQRSARAYGYDPDAYDRVIVLARQLFDRPIARAAIGARVVAVSGRKPQPWQTFAHELGHTYGFPHSNFWSVPSGADPVSPGGEAREYGDAWDLMGSPNVDTEADWRRRHFNAFFKTLAGWLPASAIANGTAGGAFRLRRHDAGDARGLRAVVVEAGDGSTYWLGMRRQFPWNASMSNGIEVRRVMRVREDAVGPVLLLDMDHGATPGIAGLSIYHSLVRFQSFSDGANTLTISVDDVSEDEMGPYADVVITR